MLAFMEQEDDGGVLHFTLSYFGKQPLRPTPVSLCWLENGVALLSRPTCG